jgi:hypothetical protein
MWKVERRKRCASPSSRANEEVNNDLNSRTVFYAVDCFFNDVILKRMGVVIYIETKDFCQVELAAWRELEGVEGNPFVNGKSVRAC